MIIDLIKSQGREVFDSNQKYFNGCTFWRIRNEGGKDLTIPYNDHPIYVGTDANNAADAEQAVKNGHGIKFTGIEFYSELYPAEQLCMAQYGYSLRTKKYIDDVCANIGLIKFEEGENLRGFTGDELYKLRGVINSDDFCIYPDGNNFVAVVEWRADIDVFPEIQFTFNHKPTQADVDTALVIRKTNYGFSQRKYTENFKCCECGQNTFWLDIPGDLRDKLDCLVERYCGSC